MILIELSHVYIIIYIILLMFINFFLYNELFYKIFTIRHYNDRINISMKY